MDVICVVQARTGSTRFPGKVLADLAGMPMLGFMLRRLRETDLPLAIATSTEPGDDDVERLGRELDIPVVRGPEDDVLSRFVLALSRWNAQAVVRLTGDCPVIDPEVVRTAVEGFAAQDVSYYSNTVIRTYPDGLDVEVVDAAALVEADRETTRREEREHVTPFLYRRPEKFKLGVFREDRYLAHVRLTVDHREDLERVRRLVAGFGGPDFTLEELLARVENEPVPDSTLVRTAMPDDDVVPAGVDLDDPGRPVFTLLRDGRPTGWATIVVHDGAGEARFAVNDVARDCRLRYLEAIRQAMGLQVTQLKDVGTTANP